MIERVATLMRVGGMSSSSPSSSSHLSTPKSTSSSSTSRSPSSVAFLPAATTTSVGACLLPVTNLSNSSNIAPPPVLLACSSSNDVNNNRQFTSVVRQEQRDILGGMSRKLCEDRRGWLDHLYPKKLMIGVVRVTMTQTTQAYSNYLSDQLQADIKRDELVQEGKLSPDEAIDDEDEWVEREWKLRLDALPHKIYTAYVKYHVITLVMRFYEEVASRFVNDVTLDKLTLDTFASAKRRQNENTKASVKEMTREGWFANLIAFLADYSVHQVILAYGYYSYVSQRRKERRQKRLAAAAQGKQPSADGDENKDKSSDDDDDLHAGSLVLSYTKKSTLLALSRVIALAMASVGGALGTLVLPGWGTLAGTNFGDGIAASITDDFVTDAFSS